LVAYYHYNAPYLESAVLTSFMRMEATLIFSQLTVMVALLSSFVCIVSRTGSPDDINTPQYLERNKKKWENKRHEHEYA